MGLLDNLLSGGSGGGSSLQEFAERVMGGSSHQSYTPQEAVSHYQQVAPQLSQDQYMQAAQQAFERLTPEQREQFAKEVQQQAAQQGQSIPGMNPGQMQQYKDPSAVAQLAGQMHQQQPGLLAQLLGGHSGGNAGSGGMSPVAKMVLGGIAAMAVKNLVCNKR